MINEDFTGKLIQRAELISEKEEYEQILDEYILNNKNDLNLFSDEIKISEIKYEIKEEFQQITNTKKILMMELDNYGKNIEKIKTEILNLTEELTAINNNIDKDNNIQNNEKLNLQYKILEEGNNLGNYLKKI